MTAVNTNRALWSIENSVGVKTGTTERAGEVLAYEYRDDSKDIFIIVMGRRIDLLYRKILDWIKEQYI